MKRKKKLQRKQIANVNFSDPVMTAEGRNNSDTIIYHGKYAIIDRTIFQN